MVNKQLINICDVKNKDVKTFVDAKRVKSVQCSICLDIPTDPMQSNCGFIFCLKCSHNHCHVIPCQVYRDKRVCDIINSLQMKCQLWRKGCRWIGEFQDYESHLLLVCISAMTGCQLCGIIVCLKDIPTHQKTSECKKRHRVVIRCPNDCNYANQKWFMKSHVTLECPKASLRCMFGFECTSGCLKDTIVRRRSTCQRNDSEKIYFECQNRTHEQIRLKHEIGFDFDVPYFTCLKRLLVQNKVETRFVCRYVKNDGHFRFEVRAETGKRT